MSMKNIHLNCFKLLIMRKILLPLALLFMFGFTSCKKCKDKDCQNDASCSLLNNEAVCTCKSLYEGDRCEIETRSKYVGVYNGSTSITIGGFTLNSNTQTYNLAKDGSSVSKFTISTTDTSNTVTYYCSLTDENSFVLDRVSPSSDMQGSGSLTDNSFSMSGNLTVGSSSATYTISARK